MKQRSFRSEKEFGLIVGGVFTLLSLWWMYRGKFSHVSPIAFSLGSILVLWGLFFPRALVYPNRVWMKLAEILSFITIRIVLAIVFFLLITPIGLVKRRLGWDPLHRRASSSETYWKPYSQRQRDHRHYEKMY